MRWTALFLLSLPLVGWAQAPPVWRHYVATEGRVASGGQTPFWLRANQWGTVPLAAPVGTARAGLFREYRPPDSTTSRTALRPPVRRFDWGVGLAGVGNAARGTTSGWLLAEAYAKIRYGRLELWGGRRREIIGLTDTTLSSGAYAVSGNALPIPKLQLGFMDYVALPFVRNKVAIRGFVAHGWFNVPYIQRALWHQKALYVRFGRPSARVQVQAGMNHQVQWAGEADYLRNTSLAVAGRLTRNGRDFLTGVVLGRNGGEWENDRLTSFDGANRVGNHLGSIDLAVTWHRPGASWLLYHQHPYDDATGLLWLNAPDGLYGLRWQPRPPSARRGWQWQHVVVEYLTTKDQTAATFDQPGTRFKGADNYFNHEQYREGWSYFGKTLGTPFLLPRTEISYRFSSPLFFPNNRVSAFYTAFAATAGPLHVVSRLSYSRNFGSFGRPFADVPGQFSGLAQVSCPLRSSFVRQGNGRSALRLTIALAVDRGRLLRHNVGGYAGLRYGY